MHPRTELLLFLSSRAQHVEEIIKPSLAQGKIVLSDRFDGSTFAYQGVARKLDLEEISKINNWSKDNIQPDLVIYIDLSIREAEERKRVEKDDRLDREAKSFHEAVRQGFLKQAKVNDNWVVVSGLGQREDIAQKIKKIIKKL